jgi:cytochrome c oxidase subunit 2
MWGLPLFPERASAIAGRVDAVFLFELGICAFFTTLICVLILFYAIKYRKGSRADRSNVVVSNPVLEAVWIAVPLVISLGIFVAATIVYFEMYHAPADAPEVYVVGRQWMWEVYHPGGKREINALHVPLGRPVRVMLTSQDVIHSFYVPSCRIKQDAVPGRYTSLWFQPDRPGTYRLFCAEYCGTKHSGMIGWIHVMDPADYERWLESGPTTTTLAQAGAQLFRAYGCSGCHGVNSTVRAPLLDGVYGHPVPLEGGSVIIADEKYIRDSILLPASQVVAGYKPVMPTFKGHIGEDELLKIIAYIKALGNKNERVEP